MEKQKNILSKRQEKWLTRNSLQNEKCIQHIQDIMGINQFDKYKIKKYDERLALYMYFKNSIYIVLIAENQNSLDILQKNVYNNKVRQIGNYQHDCCWVDAIKNTLEYERM